MIPEGAVTEGGARQGRPRSAHRIVLAAVAILATAAIAACGSSSPSNVTNKAASSYGTVLYGSLPPVGTPKPGATLTIGQITGQTPTYIMPVAPGADTSTQTISFMSNLYIPLYFGPDGAAPKVNEALSAAEPPVFSNGDKTVSITIKPGLKWANGAPVDANDVAFFYYIAKAAIAESPANWGQYGGPQVFPENVTSVSVPSQNTVVFNLKSKVNPGWFLYDNLQDTNNVFPMPSTAWNIASAGGPHLNPAIPANATKIYNYLNKAATDISGWATNPLWKDTDGPYKLTAFNATNSSFTLTPNPSYGLSPKPPQTVQFQTFTGFTAELNALKSGSLDISGIDPSSLPEVGALKAQGITVFGSPGFGWYGGIINFKDTTNHFNKVIGQLYVRQAIAHLINEKEIISGAYKGAAVPAWGPIPSSPTSPYTTSSATSPPYPYDPAAAVSLLKSHGWKVVPNGTTTCAKPGTAANECGAGIPAGTPITFTWANVPEATATTGVLESDAVASVAKQYAGINIQLITKTFNFLAADYNDQNPAASKYTNDWGVNNEGGISTDFYPTQLGLQVPINAGFNLGDYTSPTIQALVNQSISSPNPTAVDNEANYWAKNLALFYMPNIDQLIGVGKNVGGSPDGWLGFGYQLAFPQFLYVTK